MYIPTHPGTGGVPRPRVTRLDPDAAAADRLMEEPGTDARVLPMMKRTAILPVLVFSGACLTPIRPDVLLEPGASLVGYRVFVVGPVADQTGAPFNLNVTDSLGTELAGRLRSHGLPVVTTPSDTTSGVLLITSTLVAFRGMSIQLQLPGPGGSDTMCRLRDGKTGRRLGEIVSSDMGGRRPMTVLNECAHDMGDEIYRQQRG
jgi:hypothetical protein